jgi:hypothetical protein
LNKLVAGLALSTCAFATSAYLLRSELAVARKINAELISTQMAAGTPSPRLVAGANSGAGPGAPGPVATPTSLTTPANQAAPGTATDATVPLSASTAPLSAKAARKARTAASAADFLRQYDSPTGRADMRVDEMGRLSRSLAGLQEKLGIDDAKWEKFKNMMVEHEMAIRAAYARCDVDPACETPDPRYMQRFEYTERVMRDFLGNSDFKAMREYRLLAFERGVVANLQERLPANLALSAKQSEALAIKLREVRITQIDELAARGLDPGSYGGDGMSVVYPRGSATQQQAMESAQQFMQTVRDNAGAILNSGQMAVYNQMLDDSMMVFRRYHRQETAQREQKP